MFKEGSLLQVPDELIVVDEQYFAVYNYTTTEGAVMPLIVSVDLPDSFIDGAIDNAVEYTIQTFADEYGYAFLPMFNMSDLKIMDPDNPGTDIDALLENVENDLETKAKYFGKTWLLDNDVQQLFAYGAITGEDISPYLESLQVFQDFNEQERTFKELQYTNPSAANKALKDGYTALKLQAAQLGITGDGVDGLIRDLSFDIVSGRLTTSEGMNQLLYLTDDYRLAMAGGQEVLDDKYKPYLETINKTQTGMGAAKNLISEYLGADVARAFKENGLLEKYAAGLRADAQAGEGVTVNKDKMLDELQAAHDKLFPNYEGSKHSLWSSSLYKTAQNILGKAALSINDKKSIDVLSQSVGGDMTLFAGELRKKFENDPTVQDNTLRGMGGVFNQDISGVFRGQGLVGR